MSKHKYPKNGREVTKILERNGIPIRMGKGSHRAARLNNNTVLIYHDHGEFGTGIRVKIGKALAAAGLLGLISVFILPLL